MSSRPSEGAHEHLCAFYQEYWPHSNLSLPSGRSAIPEPLEEFVLARVWSLSLAPSLSCSAPGIPRIGLSPLANAFSDTPSPNEVSTVAIGRAGLPCTIVTPQDSLVRSGHEDLLSNHFLAEIVCGKAAVSVCLDLRHPRMRIRDGLRPEFH